MFIVPLYATLALSLLIGALYSPHWFISFLLAWGSLSFSAVSLAYITKTPSIFRKRQNGQIPFYIRWIFVPFLISVTIYNFFARWADKVPNIQAIEDDLFLACRLFRSDIPTLKAKGVTAILDVTAEFGGLDWSSYQDNLHYLNIPVLDHQAPTLKDMQHALNWLQLRFAAGDKVVIHCALGRGRSVWLTAAFLLHRHPEWSVDHTLEFIKHRRDTANLNKYQKKILNQVKENRSNVSSVNMHIIANPVSGGSKWLDNKDEILRVLTAHYVVVVHETAETQSASQLALLAIEQKADIIVAAGGDGTISEVANVLVKQNAALPLGILPMGTTNALAHVLLGNATKLAPVSVACDALIQNFQTPMDVALCNGQTALLVVGIGMEEQMMSFAGRAEKNEHGQFAYIEGFWKALNDNHEQTFTIGLDDCEEKISLTSLVIANASPFSSVLAQGGGRVSWNDGKLDVTWISDNENGMSNISQLFLRAITGEKVGDSDDIHYKRVENITIAADSEFKYVIDGELFSAKELNVSILPSRLTVIAGEHSISDWD